MAEDLSKTAEIRFAPEIAKNCCAKVHLLEK